MGRVVRIALALLVVVGFGALMLHRGTEGVVAPPAPLPDRADVVALVSGDTFDVRFNDHITRVTLLDVDAPALPAPVKPEDAQWLAPGQTGQSRGQCLGPEVLAEITRLIPVGTPLTLAYDKDRFGRPAAIASMADGRTVNAEMVRSGLAQVVATDARNPVPAPIMAAAQEAASTNRGLHSADIPCTVAGRVKATSAQVASLPAGPPPGAGAVDLATAANTATDVRNAAAELVSAFEQNRQTVAWLVLDQGERAALDTQTRDAMDRADAAQTTLRDAANVILNQDATTAAGRAEATLIATNLAKIRKAEAEAEADRAAEAARRLAAARKAQTDAAAEIRKQADDQARAKKDADKKDADKDSGGKDGDKKDADKDADKDDGEDSGGKKDDGAKKNDSGGGGGGHGRGGNGGHGGGKKDN